MLTLARIINIIFLKKEVIHCVQVTRKPLKNTLKSCCESSVLKED